MIPLKKMPVSEDSRGNQNIDFKQKYRNLKRKLKLLIYENECYSDELQKVQRQLLQVTRDKNFLLDQLINYENFNSTTSDSDATDSSDSETELGPVKLETPNNLKRKKPNEPGPSESPTPATTGGKKKKANLTVNTSTAATNTVPTSLTPTSTPKIRSATPLTNSFAGTLAGISGQIKPRSAPAIPSSSKGSPSVCQIAPTAPIVAVKSEPQPTHLPAMLQSLRQTQTIAPKPASLLSIVTKNEGQLTSEEIERHFESRPLQASLLIPEKTPLTVPVELFSNESSTGLNNE